MANHWFKFYGGEYISDPKMLALSACEKSCWVTLLCYASMDDFDGVVRYLSEDQLMAQAGGNSNEDEWNRTKGVLDHFQRLGMLQQSNGEITITNWRKRQETFLTNAERQARFRDKQKRNTGITRPRNESNARLDKTRLDKTRNTARFEKFWSLYPRKEGKKKAEQAFDKIDPSAEVFAKMLKGLEAHKAGEQWTKDDGKFVPHPTTWLNGERWEDEVRGGKKKSTKYDNIRTTTVR